MTEQEETGALSGETLRLVLIASFGPLLLNLSATTVNVAIDRLMAHFHAPLSTMQWVVTGYLLALGLVLPVFRWTVERLGTRRLYVWCLLGFTATSMLSAFAWSAGSLIAFRAIQGAVGGLLAPLTQALVAQLAGPKRIGRAVAIISVPVLVAPLFGPMLGGFLVQKLDWRWLFFMNAPLGLYGAWIAQKRLPPGTSDTRSRLDFRGLMLLSPGVALFIYGLSSGARARAFGPALTIPIAISIALVTLFVLDARRHPDTALVDLRIFQSHAVRFGLITFLLTNVGTFGVQLLLPIYFQQVRGESAVNAGLLVAPQGIGMLMIYPQIGKITDRYEAGRIVIVGAILSLVGTAGFCFLTDHSSYVLTSLSLVVRGIGLGCTGTPALAAIYKNLRRDEIPNTTTAINIVQRLGAPLGTAVMAMTLQRFSTGIPKEEHFLLATAFSHTFVVSAVLSGFALLSGWGLSRKEAT